jgi:hypothetical protein
MIDPLQILRRKLNPPTTGTGSLMGALSTFDSSGDPAQAPALTPVEQLQRAVALYRAQGKTDPIRDRMPVLGPKTGFGAAHKPQYLGTNVTSTGARAGQARHDYALGDGRVAHVYFDDKGKRQVFVVGGPKP